MPAQSIDFSEIVPLFPVLLPPFACAVSVPIVFSHQLAPTPRVPLESSRRISLEEAFATHVPLEFLAGSLKRTSLYISTGSLVSAKQSALSLEVVGMDSGWAPDSRHEVARMHLEVGGMDLEVVVQGMDHDVGREDLEVGGMDHDVGRVDLEVGGCYLEESVALAAANLETRCISLATE